jgi:hypothetical protein
MIASIEDFQGMVDQLIKGLKEGQIMALKVLPVASNSTLSFQTSKLCINS